MSGKLVHLSSSGSRALALTTGAVKLSASSSSSVSARVGGGAAASSTVGSAGGSGGVSSSAGAASTVSPEVKADGWLTKDERLLVNEELELRPGFLLVFQQSWEWLPVAFVN